MQVFADYLTRVGLNDRGTRILNALVTRMPHNGNVLRLFGIAELQRGERGAAASLFKRGAAVADMATRLLNVEELAKLAVLEGEPRTARQLFEVNAAAAGGTGVTVRITC